jgi:hypothetical protein
MIPHDLDEEIKESLSPSLSCLVDPAANALAI